MKKKPKCKFCDGTGYLIHRAACDCVHHNRMERCPYCQTPDLPPSLKRAMQAMVREIIKTQKKSKTSN